MLDDSGSPAHDLQSLLLQLERQWSSDAALMTELRPGLAKPEIDRMVEGTLGLPAPAEAIAWFEWHDGTSSTDIHASRAGGSTWSLLPLGRSLERYRFLLGEAQAEATLDGLEPRQCGWSDSWLPILIGGSGSTLAMECADGPGLGRLHLVDSSSEVIEDVMPSLSTVVQGWLDLYEEGVYSHSGSGWKVDVGLPGAQVLRYIV